MGRDADNIESALRERMLGHWPFEPRKASTLALDVPDVGTWTVEIRRRTVTHRKGAPERPTGRVTADSTTLVDVLEGRRSGVDAWLSNRLRVRGSIALGLKLEGLLDRTGAPAHFPVPRHTSVGGIDTFYLEAGRGPAVVLLHGLGATNASMLPTFRELARDHRVIAPDLPGFGDSGKPVRAYHAEFFADWTLQLLDKLGVDRAHFIGNSMGGRISIEVALQAPDRVDRMVLLAPAVAMRRFRQFVPIARIARPELAALPVQASHPMVVSTVRMMFSKSRRLEDSWYAAAADEFIRVFRTRRGRIAFFSAAREIYLDRPWGEGGFWKRLEALDRPAVFIWGDRDVLVPSGFAKHVETAVPHARSIVLGDCGHVPQYEHPELTHRVVRRFFDT